MRRNYSLLVLALFFALTGCTKQSSEVKTPVAAATPESSEPRHIASVDVVKAAPQALEIKAGGTGSLIVPLKIQSGYHVNANPPTYPYLKPTQLEITPGDGISASAISYPQPTTKKFAFAEKPLAVYEGDTELKATIKVDASAAKGDHSVAALLRVQACDDQVCYPPGQIDLRIPVTVK